MWREFVESKWPSMRSQWWACMVEAIQVNLQRLFSLCLSWTDLACYKYHLTGIKMREWSIKKQELQNSFFLFFSSKVKTTNLTCLFTMVLLNPLWCITHTHTHTHFFYCYNSQLLTHLVTQYCRLSWNMTMTEKTENTNRAGKNGYAVLFQWQMLMLWHLLALAMNNGIIRQP